jgi:hypothetical protein
MKPIHFIREAFYRRVVGFLVAPVSGASVRRTRGDLESLLQPGDVILVAGKTRYAALVGRMTHSPWSHVAIYVGSGHHPDAAYCVVEADVEAGVRMITLDDLAGYDIQVVRASRLPESSRKALIDYLVARVGLGYDLDHAVALALVLFAPWPLTRWLGPRILRRADPTRALCSTLVGHALSTAGIPVGAGSIVSARLRCAAKEMQADLRSAMDYLVPSDFEHLPEFDLVFNSRQA